MSPFYFKEGENWIQWDRRPKDIKNGADFGIGIYACEDPEKVIVDVINGAKVYVRGERGNVIFPGKNEVLNRDGFEVIEASTGKTLVAVIHSDKPIVNK